MAKIIVVDDDPEFCHRVGRFLKAEIDCARSAKQGAWLILGRPFDLAIINLELPDGRGTELAALAVNENLPVLLTSDRMQPAAELDTLGLPLIRKTAERAELVAKTAQIMNAVAENIRVVKESTARLRATGGALREAIAESRRLLAASREIVARAALSEPARVVLVHENGDFRGEIATALETLGCQVTSYHDPLAAWSVFDLPQKFMMLITSFQFTPHQPHGVALARKATYKNPRIRILFIGPPSLAEHVDGLGELVPDNAIVPEVVEAVARVLRGAAEAAARGRTPR